MWVKVCGMTNGVDVAQAVTAGADAVGFVVAPRSQRYVDANSLAGLVAAADGLTTVVVSANQPADVIIELAIHAGADWVQPHGRFQEQVIAGAMAAGLGVLAPVSVGEMVGASGHIPEGICLLLDTKVPGLDGGTGTTFDWSLANDMDRRFVLAGGLGPDNVAEAVAVAHPWGVDAVTMLEAAPGIKDHTKVTDFIRKAKGS
ncbi:Phosphoribosylanthranilate isomerase [hydrothermal vent metagenome]|uniref:phosphoribosylanthranilate isomerase n=1 Tax=hydrothermal vent metagenome TaxID=652676 RepID=A0A3B0SNA6_9ZZZZ